MKNNILQEIERLLPEFSKKQKILAEYILVNYQTAAFMNSVQMAAAAGVSNPTVIRFASMLGFDGFNSMQHALQSLLQQDLSSVDRLSLLSNYKYTEQNRETNNVDNRLSFFYQELYNLDTVVKSLNGDDITDVANLIAGASCVLISGYQASVCLADYFIHNLSKIHPRVECLKEWNLQTYQLMVDEQESKVAILFALSRYPNRAIDCAKRLASHNIPLVLITDSEHCPAAEYAQFSFIIPVSYYSFVDPFSSVITLINCLLVEISKIDPETVKRQMQLFESYSLENNIFFHSPS